MDEREFWGRLEWRVCRELEGLPDNHLRFWWCDGFMPDEKDVEAGLIRGLVWMGNGRRMEEWDFELHTGVRLGASAEIAWPALLPADDLTGWLFVDPNGRRMVVRPREAYLDRTANR